MPSQTAIDFSRFRARAVELDGSLKSPKIKAFSAVDLPVADPGEDPEALHSRALADLIRSQRMVKDPAACSLDSYDCTFREMDLPFSSPDQIDKVIKFEAESELHLVDIDDVVIAYHSMGVSHDGSHLLVMAYDKEAVRRRLGHLDAGGVDPVFADLHLTALYTALKETGYLGGSSEEVEPESDELGEAGDEDGPDGHGIKLIIECDLDVSHLLVTRGQELIAARAIRLGTTQQESSNGTSNLTPPSAETDAGEEQPVPEPQGEDDEIVVLEMDDEVGTAYFHRLRRELQRTLFPLGLEEAAERVLITGSRTADPAFVERLQVELGREVEVVRPYDRVDHDLDPAILDTANAEGVAALGVGLRMLGSDVSRIDFRQEEVRYARRFDQVKVALACLAIMLLIFVFLHALVRVKEYMNQQEELHAAATSAFTIYQSHTADRNLGKDYNDRVITAHQAIEQIRRDLQRVRDNTASEIGREGSIPQVPSGLDVLNALIGAMDGATDQLGRIEVNLIDMDLTREKPIVRIKGILENGMVTDVLIKALERCPVVKSVQLPQTQPASDGRVEFSQLEVLLKDNYRVAHK